jgi:hypothetical protein
MYVLYKKRFVVVAPAILLVIAYTGTVMRVTMLIYTSNMLLFVGVACVVLDFMANLRTGADMLKALEAWISAYFLLLNITNVLCSGKLALSSNQRSSECSYESRSDYFEDFRHRKPSPKHVYPLANCTSRR